MHFKKSSSFDQIKTNLQTQMFTKYPKINKKYSEKFVGKHSEPKSKSPHTDFFFSQNLLLIKAKQRVTLSEFNHLLT